jgi:hypothetical protein
VAVELKSIGRILPVSSSRGPTRVGATASQRRNSLSGDVADVFGEVFYRE